MYLSLAAGGYSYAKVHRYSYTSSCPGYAWVFEMTTEFAMEDVKIHPTNMANID